MGRDLAKQRAYSAEWRRKNPERARELRRQWALANPEKKAAGVARWKKANPDKMRVLSRRGRLKARYGLTPEKLDALRAAQDSRCAICGTDGLPLHIDHDHSTGRVRGLLCHGCNTGIGRLKDDPRLLEAGAAYLRRAHSVET